MAWDCRGPKRNKGRDNPMDKEKMIKIFQEMMVKCYSKPEDFQYRRRLPGDSLPRVTVINVR